VLVVVLEVQRSMRPVLVHPFRFAGLLSLSPPPSAPRKAIRALFSRYQPCRTTRALSNSRLQGTAALQVGKDW
jgi:hypothetical protein